MDISKDINSDDEDDEYDPNSSRKKAAGPRINVKNHDGKNQIKAKINMDVFYILFMDKIENSDNFEYEYSSDSNNESVDCDSDKLRCSESTGTSDSCETSDDEDVRECASEEEKDEKEEKKRTMIVQTDYLKVLPTTNLYLETQK